MRKIAFLAIVLALVAGGSWWFFAHREAAVSGSRLTVYYTKIDGTSLGAWTVSMRPPQPGESAAEHLTNMALYAAVQSAAGPPSDVEAIRFPPGTHINNVTVHGSVATVDLSHEVTQQVGGTFSENGEFKGLVYTMTGVPGIRAVQVTVDGQKLETLPGGHVELDEPLRRSDF
ncbi:MAG: GerMN domain-containing protein [Vulcanimicrobiaceae bacterium]